MGRYICKNCLADQPASSTCGECQGEEFFDRDEAGEEERQAFRGELGQRAQTRQRKFVLMMEAMAILLCAILLFVGLTVSAGLGGGAVDWGVKIGVVVVLAVAWRSIPRIYGRQLTGRPTRWLLELSDEE